jgi:hypothetical protein
MNRYAFLVACLSTSVVDSVNEFGGVTGSFHKSAMSYQVSEQWNTLIVHHRMAGVGGTT